ncbi:MAG: RHS repeat-associated core domain-containing protein, partial [Ginsengibacter sp.]
VDVATKSFYKSGGIVQSPNSTFTDILNSLSAGIVTATAGGHGAITDLTNSTSPVYAALNSFLPTNDPNTTGKPKAYLNWILLNDQFQGVNTYPQSGAIPVGSADVLNTLGYSGIPITKNGYLYIWVSNETPGWDVFFDNLSIQQRSGPITEETHYYPFGLTMAGISSKAAVGVTNKYLFNSGNELQNKEFSDGSGLELYDAEHRMYDPQIGRFGQIDEFGEMALSISPYSFASDNPISRNDPMGLKDTIAITPASYLAPIVIFRQHNQQHLENIYWSLINQGISFERVKYNGLRNELQHLDVVEKWLQKIHLEQREEEEEWLEYGSWLIPGGEIGELVATKGIVKGAIELFALKRGKAMLISGAADLTTQITLGKGNLLDRIKNVNILSTVSSSIFAHPLISSTPGTMFKVSYNTVTNGGISQLSDPNLIKTIILTRSASFGGKGYLGESASGIVAGKADQFIHFENN